MRTFILKLPAAEVVHLLRSETEIAYGAPELDISSEKEYVIEEDFDRAAYGIRDGGKFDLVTSVATLSIEPRVESGYWILETSVERSLGALQASQEDDLARTELTLDEFETELRSPGRKCVRVSLYVQTPAVRQDFDRWLGEMEARHPWKAKAGPAPVSLTTDVDEKAKHVSGTREAVGVFSDPDALETAVDELEGAGFDRTTISVLATDAKAKQQVDRFYRSIRDVEDSGRVARAAFVSRHSRSAAEAAAIGAPLYIGGAGAAAVASAAGDLALTIAATIAGAAAGAGIGALLVAVIAQRHLERVEAQLDKGGLILWVSVPNPEAEKRAVAILEKVGARDVHVHEIPTERTLSDIPFALLQPDPFLESDWPPIKHAAISARVKKKGHRRASPVSHRRSNGGKA